MVAQLSPEAQQKFLPFDDFLEKAKEIYDTEVAPLPPYTIRTMMPEKKYLVLSGGGEKGILFAGAIAALEDTNKLESVEHVSGSSAGAMIATLLALGVTVKEINNFIISFNFRDKAFLDFNTPWYSPSLAEADTREKIEAMAARITSPELAGISQKKSSQTTKGAIDTVLEGAASALGLLAGTSTGMIKGMTITSLFNSIARLKLGKENPTFADLAEAIEQDDDHSFRHLTITATELQLGCIYFTSDKTNFPEDYEKYKDIPIAHALRASISYPGLFEGVSLGGNKVSGYYQPLETPNLGKTLLFVDGGLLNNYPIAKFQHLKPVEVRGCKENLAVLGIKLASQHDIDCYFESKTPEHKEPPHKGFDILTKMLTILIDHQMIELEHSRMTTALIHDQGLHTFNFKQLTTKQKSQAIAVSRTAMRNYIRDHIEGAVVDEKVLKHLTIETITKNHLTTDQVARALYERFQALKRIEFNLSARLARQAQPDAELALDLTKAEQLDISSQFLKLTKKKIENAENVPSIARWLTALRKEALAKPAIKPPPPQTRRYTAFNSIKLGGAAKAVAAKVVVGSRPLH